jgi:Domain of unknown function (DUF3576)
MKKLFTISALVMFCAALSACTGFGSSADYKDTGREKMYKDGSLASEKGGLEIFGGTDSKKESDYGLSVNGYLWRAALDTLAFMPILSADPFGGVILTDWYSPAGATNERVKANVYIMDKELRADGVRVSVFRQTKDGGEGTWVDAGVSPATASSIEEAILTRARQMRLAAKERFE